MRRALITLTAVAGLVLAGCGGGSDSDSGGETTVTGVEQSTAAAAPQVTATVAPGPWTTEQAQAKYLEYVAPLNTLNDQYGDIVRDEDAIDYPALRAMCGQLADATDTFSRQLAQGQWPANATQAITNLISADSLNRTVWMSCSKSTDNSVTYQVLSDGLPTAQAASAAAQTVRVLLGLPGTGG